MSNYYNDQWRLPNNENKDKQSNYSIDKFDLNDYISTPLTIDEFSSATMSIWFKTSLSQNDKYFLTFPEASGANGFDLNFVTSGIKSYLQCHSGSNSLTSSFTYNDGNWHHVIVSYSGTNHKMYIDGVLTASASASIGTIKNAEGNLYIGGLSSLYPAYRVSQTKLDQVAVFDYALSDGGVSVGQTATGQIATLYGGGSAIGNPMSLSPAPVAYYPLGDQDAFNGADYLVPNSSLKDYVFSFDADYIDTFEIPATYTALTLSCWVNFDNLTAYSTVLGQWVNNSFANSTVLMYLDNTGKIQVLYSTGSSYTRAGLNTTLSTNTWYNLVTTWDGTTVKLYVNSFLQTTTGSLSSLNDANVTLKLGAYNSGASTINHLDGKLSNAQIFNTELPATGSNSVETLYNNGSPLTSISGFTSLQGWWKLDASATYDGSDWTIPDDSSNSNDGTSSGMTQANLVQSDLSFTSGYSPYALDFDGTNDYINIPSFMSNLPSNDIYTISTWIKTNSDTNAAWGSSNTGSALLYAYITNGTTFGIGRGSVTRVDISNLLIVGEWANVVAVFDSSTNLKIYINGVFIQDVTVGSLGTVTDDFKIGGALNGYNLACSQSNVSVWNAALTSSQVTEIYNEGVPSNLNNHSAYSNLVSWWQLGSNSSFNTNWTVLDEKGSNNGTSVNMIEVDIVDGVGSYANGLSSGMGGDEVIGDAPYSSSNSLSVNMDVEDRTTDTPS